MAEDFFTSTVDGAAGFERAHGREYDRDRPEPDYEPYIVDEDIDEDDGIEHPPWCTLPPYHSPYATVKVQVGASSYYVTWCCEPKVGEGYGDLIAQNAERIKRQFRA